MENPLAKRLGQALRAARKAKGLTQEDAAESCGISLEFFARMERGATLPSVPTLARLAVALEVRADVLLGLGDAGAQGRVVSTTSNLSSPTSDPPELRRLIRRMRRARPRTVRLLAVLAAELER